MQEAAHALGKSINTIKKWINENKIPAPILKCSSHGYLQYSEGELHVIAKFFSEFSNENVYLSKSNASILESLWQQMEGHRRSNV